MQKLNPQVVEGLRRNYDGGDLSCNDLIRLLEERVAPGALAAKNVLVQLMASARHRNLRQHTEGSKDGTMHYTIFVQGKGYHLRVDRQGVIFHITDKTGTSISGSEPWVRPGG